jgi:hypothetical protein
MHPYGQEDDHCRDWEGTIDRPDIANGDWVHYTLLTYSSG